MTWNLKSSHCIISLTFHHSRLTMSFNSLVLQSWAISMLTTNEYIYLVQQSRENSTHEQYKHKIIIIIKIKNIYIYKSIKNNCMGMPNLENSKNPSTIYSPMTLGMGETSGYHIPKFSIVRIYSFPFLILLRVLSWQLWVVQRVVR